MFSNANSLWIFILMGFRNAPPDFVQQNIRKMLLFAVAYSASVGGTGSLVGTGPIKVFKELIKE